MKAGWIGGRRFDLVFFFGSALLAALVGAFALAVPGAVVPLFVAFLVLVDGPHLVATWARTYLDPDFRARRGRLLALSLAWLLPGLAAWSVTRATGLRAPIDLFLLAAALWSFHHNVRQSYGVLAIYQHHARTALPARKTDRLFLHGALWLAFGLFSFGHPQNRVFLGLPAEPPRLLATLGLVLLGLLLVATVGYGVYRRTRFRGEDERPLLYLLGPTLGLQLFALFVVGSFEPLVPRPADPEQAFMASTVVGGTVHGVNYLGIIAAVSRRRFEGSDARTLVASFGRRPLVAYAAFVLVSLGYLALNAARGVLPSLAPVSREAALPELFLVLYWGLFFHHYYIDQKIWHVRDDQTLRFELGLGGVS
ncbi:hypothetical protein [Polyangium sorediatum]|uniref:Beta-carotene 15,15'-monooxygenase n=1 Tax=Polyangium sorediatum TaxID=889274 RepID=A0ABT6NVN5_9BACT|nr:hypothetical protein [Polyangium sorediatum]MDI1432361.1 hypothetical protein [Polyangium sorediatum]